MSAFLFSVFLSAASVFGGSPVNPHPHVADADCVPAPAPKVFNPQTGCLSGLGHASRRDPGVERMGVPGRVFGPGGGAGGSW